MEITSMDQSREDMISWYYMRGALVEVTDLLIMYACELMHWGTLVVSSEHLYRDTMQIIVIQGFSCAAAGGGYGGFLVFTHWKKMDADKLSTSTAWRGDIWNGGFNIWPCFIPSLSITRSMAHCTGEHGIHTPNKPNPASDKHSNTHGHPVNMRINPTHKQSQWRGQQKQQKCLDVHMRE